MAVILERSFPVEAGAFTTAGEASTTIKRTLKQLGVDAEVLRHVSVACYEVELNLVIHSEGGTSSSLDASKTGFERRFRWSSPKSLIVSC